MKTDILHQMNAEKPDDVLASLEAKHDSPAMTGSDASPALTTQSKHYPARWNGRVPKRIKMLMNVRPDAWCGAIGQGGGPGTILRYGETYDAWTNSHGAVAGYCANGCKLGVKPDEFEIVEWYETKHQNDKLCREAGQKDV